MLCNAADADCYSGQACGHWTVTLPLPSPSPSPPHSGSCIETENVDLSEKLRAELHTSFFLSSAFLKDWNFLLDI